MLLKYDGAGSLLWSHIAPGFGWALARVATDAQGDVVVTGTAPAGVVQKFARSGGLLWTRPLAANSVQGLAIAANGTIVVAGNLATNIVTAAFDPAGNPLWTTTTTNATGATDLVLGAAGEIYVGGAAVGVTPLRSLVARFDSAGNPLWVQNYAGTQVRRLAVDSRGDVITISGESPNGGYFNWRTQKLAASGTVLWSTTYDRHNYNDEIPYALTIGPDDEVYVTGQGGPGPSSGSLSYLRTVTVRYDRSGAEEWAATSFTSLRGLGVVRLQDNSIATVGESTFTVFHYRQSGVWQSLGGALAGVSGSPRLRGTGSPTGNLPVSLELDRARPNAANWLIGGIGRANLPFQGGLLIPTVDLVLPGVTTANGTMSVPFPWPAVLPPGFELTFQVWLTDAAAPLGYAASNALVGITR